MQTMHLSLKIQPHVEPEALYPTIDRVIAHIKASGLAHIVGPMETSIEGEIDELLALVKAAHQICLDAGADRVSAVITTDLKRAPLSFDEKLAPYRD